MANLVWTGILYFSTLSIVYAVYRAFVVDRQAEGQRKTQELINRSYGAAAGQVAAQAASAAQPAQARFPLKRQPAPKPSLGGRAYRP